MTITTQSTYVDKRTLKLAEVLSITKEGIKVKMYNDDMTNIVIQSFSEESFGKFFDRVFPFKINIGDTIYGDKITSITDKITTESGANLTFADPNTIVLISTCIDLVTDFELSEKTFPDGRQLQKPASQKYLFHGMPMTRSKDGLFIIFANGNELIKMREQSDEFKYMIARGVVKIQQPSKNTTKQAEEPVKEKHTDSCGANCNCKSNAQIAKSAIESFFKERFGENVEISVFPV